MMALCMPTHIYMVYIVYAKMVAVTWKLRERK